jgi:hypothetical protein
MRNIMTSVIVMASALASSSALASQGPGTGPGTASPLLQWLAVLSVIALATLGVIFAQWDDGKYKDF